MPPNLLFLIADDHRHDAIGSLGTLVVVEGVTILRITAVRMCTDVPACRVWRLHTHCV